MSFSVFLSLCLLPTDAFCSIAAPVHGEIFRHAQPFTPLSDLPSTAHPRLLSATTQWWDRASVGISIGDIASAEAEFIALLQAYPDFYPDWDTPPKIMIPFLRIRRQFLSEKTAEKDFRVEIIAAVAQDGKISLTMHACEAVLSLLTEVTVHVRTRSQTAFRSIRLSLPIQQALELNFRYPMTTGEHLEYYVDFVGRFGEPFYSIGSPQTPRILAAQETQMLTPSSTTQSNAFAEVKAYWPIIMSAAIAVAGTLMFGMLKLHH